MNSEKTSQDSDIPTKLIKQNIDIFTDVLHSAFNNYLENAIYPSILKTVDVIPLHTFLYEYRNFHQEDLTLQETSRTSLQLFEVPWNDHLVNYFSLMYRCKINTNILHLTFSRADI